MLHRQKIRPTLLLTAILAVLLALPCEAVKGYGFRGSNDVGFMFAAQEAERNYNTANEKLQQLRQQIAALVAENEKLQAECNLHLVTPEQRQGNDDAVAGHDRAVAACENHVQRAQAQLDRMVQRARIHQPNGQIARDPQLDAEINRLEQQLDQAYQALDRAVNAKNVAIGQGNRYRETTITTPDKLAKELKLRANNKKLLELRQEELVYAGELDVNGGVKAKGTVLAARERYYQVLTGNVNMKPGTLIAQGIAGEDFGIDGTQIDSWTQGLSQGLLLATAKEFGIFVRKKVGGLFQELLGDGFDAVVNVIVDGTKSAYRAVFCGGKEPFTPLLVDEWHRVLKSACDGIEKLHTNGLRDSMRGHDMSLRMPSLLGGGDAADEGDAFAAAADIEGAAGKKKVGLAEQSPFKTRLIDDNGTPVNLQELDVESFDIWHELMQGYVALFVRLYYEIEVRKDYYKPHSSEVFYATLVQKMMQNYAVLLMKSKTLAELDQLIGSNKAVLVQMRDGLLALLTQLKQVVQPRTYSSTKPDANSYSSSYDRSSKSRSRYDYDDDYGYGYGRSSSNSNYPSSL